MGALVALEFAASHSKLVNGICLMGISARMPVNEDLLKAAKNDDPLAYDLITSWSHGTSGHFGKTPVPGLSLIGGGRALMNSVPKGSLAIGLNACNNYRNGIKAAEKILCPTLCILGNEDKMTPARKGKEIAETINGAKTVLVCLAAIRSLDENLPQDVTYPNWLNE